MKRWRFILGCLLLGAALGSAARASPAEQAWPVRADQSIQSAIQRASDGDVILVAPGLYRETLDFLGKAITVRSTAGPRATIVDAGGRGSVVSFVNGETTATVLEGFTLTGGTGTEIDGVLHGGGVFCQDAGPTLRDNWILDNHLAASPNGRSKGAGVYARRHPAPGRCYLSCIAMEGNLVRGNVATDGLGGGAFFHDLENPSLIDNVFEGNTARAGAGIWFRATGGTLEDSVIRDNVATTASSGLLRGFVGGLGGGIGMDYGATTAITRVRVDSNVADAAAGGVFLDHSPAVLTDVLIARNEVTDRHGAGGGIYTFGDFELQNVTIARNACHGIGSAGGGMYCDADHPAARVENTIVWGNTADRMAGVQVTQGPFNVDYSDVQLPMPLHPTSMSPYASEEEPAHLLHLDPCFVDPAHGDFRLLADSPLVDAGNPAVLTTRRDLRGFPRLLDGKLDRQMIIDIGAYEFGNVELDITGQPSPGETLTLEVTGRPGLVVLIFGGTAPGEALARPYGPMYFDSTQPLLFYVFGVTPDSRPGILPDSMTTPQPVVVQALGFGLFSENGNFSNSIEFTVE